MKGIEGEVFTCNTATSSSMAQQAIFARGEKTMICVHFWPQKVKIGFSLVVDQFISLSFRNIYELMMKKSTDLVLQLANSQMTSKNIPYIRPEERLVFPIINILITLKNGLVSSIKLEDISEACPRNIRASSSDLNQGSMEELKGNCDIPPCQDKENAAGRCDFKIFVSWIGTDRNGDGLLSASERLSNYKNYNMEAMFQSILDIENNTVIGTPDRSIGKGLNPDVQDRLN